MIRKRFEIVTTILFICIIFFAALNAVRFFTRFDITENNVYTISDVSKNLFQEIPEQVTITYYRSNKLRDLSSIPEQIEDLLYEYAAYSRGKIIVKVVDPAESGEEQIAETLGVVPQQVEVLEKNERSYPLIYSGIVIEYLAEYETIPMIVATETLEYDLTNRIRSLVKDRERRIGILVGDVGKQLERDYSMLLESIRNNFSYTPINLGDPVPPDITVLLVIGNKDIREEHLQIIDEYIKNGGNTCFLAESIYVNLAANLQASVYENTVLLNYLEKYGVSIEPSFVCDEYNRQFRVPTRVFGNVAWQVIGPYPLWVSVLQQNVSTENPVTARFFGLDLLWPNPISINEKEGIEYEILLTSSEKSWLLKEQFNTNPYQAQMLKMFKTDSQGPYNMGVLLSGNWSGDNDAGPNSRIMVISDADFISNIMQYSNSMQNTAFLQNGLEWLSNDEDLLEIKTRANRDVRLNKIENPEARRKIYLFAVIINVVVIPLIFVLFGIRRFLSRRKKMNLLEE